MTNIEQNSDGSYTFRPRKAGLEAAAVGAGMPPDIAGAELGALDAGMDVAAGGVVSYLIYSCALAVLDTIPEVRAGRITRTQQLQIVSQRVWQSTSGAVPTVVITAVVLAIFPWLSGPAFIAGIFGAGVMGTRVVRAAFDALPDEQKEELKQKADALGVQLAGLTDDSSPATAAV